METNIYCINAFSSLPFGGNPAAVCPLENFLSDSVMQSIAAQNNLAETAFIVPIQNNHYKIRWFAPKQEVKLCGHATLAAAYVVFNTLQKNEKNITFDSASGPLLCSKSEHYITLDFPARPHEKVAPPEELIAGINCKPKMVLGSDDYLVVLDNQLQIQELEVDMDKLTQLDRRGVVFTAPGDTVDFASRVFHPKLGIGEDPVCGSAHCELTPYWSEVFKKTNLHAWQLSARKGELWCEIKGNRVFLKGECNSYLTGIINF